MLQELASKYEKDKDSEEIASLTSGKEMKSYNGHLKITGSSSFNTSTESNTLRLVSVAAFLKFKMVVAATAFHRK